MGQVLLQLATLLRLRVVAVCRSGGRKGAGQGGGGGGGDVFHFDLHFDTLIHKISNSVLAPALLDPGSLIQARKP